MSPTPPAHGRRVSGEQLSIARKAKADVARAISLPSDRISVVELRGGSYLVIDLHSAPQHSSPTTPSPVAPSSVSSAAADALGYHLVDALLDETSPLYLGELTREIEPRYGVLRLSLIHI